MIETLIPKHSIKSRDRGFCIRARKQAWQLDAQKLLEKGSCETWFDDAKSRLHMAEISFQIAKTAICKRTIILKYFSVTKTQRSLVTIKPLN